ncbi:MAG: hypothetical protein AAF533_12885 [Acidobacteriota bacterium]
MHAHHIEETARHRGRSPADRLGLSLLLLASFGLTSALAQDEALALYPPDWSGAPREFATGATAAMLLPEGHLLLFAGTEAWYYSALAGEGVKEPLSFPFAVHAALPWDLDEAWLFSDDLVFRYSFEQAQVTDVQPLAAYDLPEGWHHVDAATWLDDERALWFNGDEVLILDMESHEREGPYPITYLGLPELWRDLDAATRSTDDFVTLFRQGRALEMTVGTDDPLLGRATAIGDSDDVDQLPRPPVQVTRLEPRFDGLDPSFRDGITAGACLPDEGCLLIRRDRATLYVPQTGQQHGSFDLGRSIDAALRWSSTEIALFSGRSFVVVDHLDPETPASSSSLSELGLPDHWQQVNAAVVVDDSKSLLVNEGEFFVLHVLGDDEPPAIQGPFPLSRLGWGFWADGIDALMNLMDGRLSVHRGDGWALVDVRTGETEGPFPLVQEMK